jgi:hypothetical protein
LARSTKAEAAILRVLFDAYPAVMYKADLAALAGYEPSGGGFNNSLGRLRTLELITRGAEISASEEFFQ